MSQQSEIRLFVIGESHILPKTFRHFEHLYTKYGVHTWFHLDDASGKTRQNIKSAHFVVFFAYDFRNRLLTWLLQILQYIWLLLYVRPHIIEVYSGRHPILIYIMMKVASVLKIPSVVILRGPGNNEIDPLLPGRPPLIQHYREKTLNAAKWIVYKEGCMEKILTELGVGSKSVFIHNAVPILDTPIRNEREIDVLFLNRIVPWRNVDIVVRAIAKVVQRGIPINAKIVGKISKLIPERVDLHSFLDYELFIERLVNELGIQEFVTIEDFSDTPNIYFEGAKIFLLPAQAVFANYSLLEAMERGVIPIVSDMTDPYARYIVDDGINGFVTSFDPEEISERIIRLLRDEDLLRLMSNEARRKIQEKFGLEQQIDSLYALYRSLREERN